jgi:hypothetical protein
MPRYRGRPSPSTGVDMTFKSDGRIRRSGRRQTFYFHGFGRGQL